MRSLIWILVLLVFSKPFTNPSWADGDIPKFKKILIVVLENTNASSAKSQPFLKQLATQGAYLNEFYAVTHPSQPNYIAMIAGDTLGVNWDSDYDVEGKSIADLIEAKGKTWKTYQEGYPGGCFTGSKKGSYYRKHNPFISMNSIRTHPERCSHIVNEAELEVDISKGNLPDYSLYVPGIENDGHDTDVKFADQWLKGAFEKRLQDPAFMKDLLFVVTFDESGLFGGNHIYTALVGDGVKPGFVSNQKVGFYDLLKTIEDQWGLGNLGKNDEKAKGITDVWK